MKPVIPWATVVPAKGRLKETARDLLDLAGDPFLVRTSGNGTTFDVPESIADAYHELKAQEETPPALPSRPKTPQRRGRPPRVPTEE